MLGYNTFTVNTLLLLQVLAIGLCGTYFNFCIVLFVCLGYYFRETISRSRRVYDNVHTTYVLFIVMCCGVSFAMQSITLSTSSRNLALAKSSARDTGECQITAFDSIDELAARFKQLQNSQTRYNHKHKNICGPAAYDRVRLADRYPLQPAGEIPILFGEDWPRLYTRECQNTTLRCFHWCIRLDKEECFRPAWSMVYNIYTTNARTVHLALDTTRTRVQAWPEYIEHIPGGAQLHSRLKYRGGLSSFKTHLNDTREIDRMPEPYTDEFIVIEPHDTSLPSTIEIRVHSRCIRGARTCTIQKPVSASVSISMSLTQLAQGSAIVPYTIIPVASKCSTIVGAQCELELTPLIVAHIINTLVIIASIYVAVLTHALDAKLYPVSILLAATCIFSLNWIGLVSITVSGSRRPDMRSAIYRTLLRTLQIAQLGLIAYDFQSVNFAHSGLLEAYTRDETRWAFWVLAPGTLLHGPVYFISCVLAAAGTGVLFIDGLRIVRLYEHT